MDDTNGCIQQAEFQSPLPSSQSLPYLQHLTVPLIGSWMSPSITTTILAKAHRLSSLKWGAATVWIKDNKGCLGGAATDLFSAGEIAREPRNAHLWLLSPSFPIQPLRAPAQLKFWGAGDAVLGCKTISAFLPCETQWIGNCQGGLFFFTCECPSAKAPARITTKVLVLQSKSETVLRVLRSCCHFLWRQNTH